MEKSKEYQLAMMIVNQILDIAEVSVEKRQKINDQADEYVYNIIAPIQKKANKWDKLDAQILKCYQDENGKEYSEDEGGDLCTIGEIAAIAFGYL